MTTIHPDAKKKMMEAAAKAFPKKDRETLEAEFGEMMRLETRPFHSGRPLSSEEQKRLKDLHEQFSPKNP